MYVPKCSFQHITFGNLHFQLNTKWKWMVLLENEKKVLWNVSNMCHKTCILKSVSKQIDSQLTLSQKNTTWAFDVTQVQKYTILIFFSGQTLIILHILTFCNCYWTQNSYVILWILSEVQFTTDFQFR